MCYSQMLGSPKRQYARAAPDSVIRAIAESRAETK